jgi:hypothetical protein
MIFLVLTRLVHDQLMEQSKAVPLAIWANSGVLSEGELLRLRDSGVEVTNFLRPIDTGNPSAVEGAVATVREHHVGQTIWVEHTLTVTPEK